MNRKLIIISFLFICLSAMGQTIDNTKKRDRSNIYNQSFVRYLSYLQHEKLKTPDSIYIESDYKLTDSLMLKIGKTKLIIIQDSDLTKTLKKESKTISLYRLFPLAYQNKKFVISILPFGVHYNKTTNEIHFINGGGYSVIFTFEKGMFKFKQIINNGI